LAFLALYLALSSLLPGITKFHGDAHAGAVYVLENVLLLPGIFNVQPLITVAWSLSYEFFFYLSILAVVGLTRMRRWPKVARVIFFVIVWLTFTGYSFTLPRSQVRLLMFISGDFVP
jgi:exopolysaccharide production protein ExoZ